MTDNKFAKNTNEDSDNYAERVNEFAESVSNFFIVFDGLFLHEEDAEQLLTDLKKHLKNKISRNETALPVIMAMGGNYDSDIDRAKVQEVDALLNMIKARKNLQKAEEAEHKKKNNNAELLALFGL